MTSILFERDALVRALDAVAQVRPWQRDLKKSGLLRISPIAGGVRIVSSDLERSIAAIVAGEGSLDREVFLPLDALKAAVGKFVSGNMVDISPTSIGAQVLSGRSRLNLAGSEHDAAPLVPDVDGDPALLGAATMRAGLASTDDATSHKDEQPHLGGVFVRGGPTGPEFVAMDGNRIHARAMDGNRIHARAMDGNRIHAQAIIPRRTVNILLALLPDEGDVSIRLDARRVTVTAGNLTISSTLIDGTFPAHEPQFRASSDRTLTANADQLLADIEVVATVADPRDNDVRLDLGETCTASAVRAQCSNGPPASGEIDLIAEFAGAPLAIGFQVRLVRDALVQFGDKVVEWRMAGPHDPTFISSPALPGLQILISPFRLKSAALQEAA